MTRASRAEVATLSLKSVAAIVLAILGAAATTAAFSLRLENRITTIEVMLREHIKAGSPVAMNGGDDGR